MSELVVKKITIGEDQRSIIDLSDATAQPRDVAVGKLFYGADGSKKAGEGAASSVVLGTLTVDNVGEYDVANYPGIDGWSHVSATLSKNLQTQSISLGTDTPTRIITPAAGYDGLASVSVSVSNTSKTATPSSGTQTITGGNNRWLSQVTINPVPTDSTPTFTPTSSTQTKTATNWYKSVKIAAVPTDSAPTITPQSTSQTKTATNWYKSVTVAAVPTETKTVTPTEAAQTVTASDNKWFKTITVDKINVAATPTVKENTTLTAPDGQYYKEVIIDVEGTGGTNTTDATATAADILVGKSAYIASGKVDGTIPTYDKSFTGGVEITTTTVSDGTPIIIKDESAMNAVLSTATIGQTYRYVGHNGAYRNGALYRVSGVVVQ